MLSAALPIKTSWTIDQGLDDEGLRKGNELWKIADSKEKRFFKEEYINCTLQ
jgi:hypothetical protein